jgi:hypothetical protein
MMGTFTNIVNFAKLGVGIINGFSLPDVSFGFMTRKKVVPTTGQALAMLLQII